MTATKKSIFLMRTPPLNLHKFLQIDLITSGADLQPEHNMNQSDVYLWFQVYFDLQIDKGILEERNGSFCQKDTHEVETWITVRDSF